MNANEAYERITRCMEKIGLEDIISITLDEDEEADIYIDPDGRIYVYEVLSPYKTDDIETIKYKSYNEIDNEYDYVKIRFFNDDEIVLNYDNAVEVFSDIRGYVLCASGREECMAAFFPKILDETVVRNGKLIAFPECEDDPVIPDRVDEIGSYAFWGRDNKEIVIPDGVTSIGYNAFGHCGKFEKIDIPGTVKKIYSYAFYHAENLKAIAIPEIESIYQGTFMLCASLSDVTVPDSVEVIHERAFFGCGSITDITVPDNTKINKDAFYDCKNIRLKYRGNVYTYDNIEEAYS